MKGTRAEPLAGTSKPPRSRRKITIGASHHFLRSRGKSQNSLVTLEDRQFGLFREQYYNHCKAA
jgi:hypothetical protein